jgi:hypothetical protein
MRYLRRVDVPQPGQLGDMRVVAPVAKGRQIAVGAAFPGVLGGRLKNSPPV